MQSLLNSPRFLFSLAFLLLSLIDATCATVVRPAITTEPTVSGSWSCGNITVQHPLSLYINSTSVFCPSATLAHSLLCKSQILYLRTSLGLFPVSYIDTSAKTLILSSPRCAFPSSRFVSPILLSSAFSAPPHPHNILLLFNCNSHNIPVAYSLHNCTTAFCGSQNPADEGRNSSCWLLHDLNRWELGLHPSDLGCSHYARVFTDHSSSNGGGVEFGTRVSFAVPVHLPNICEECSKPGGYCGIGLRCICHPNQCEDRILSSEAASNDAAVMSIAYTIYMWLMLLIS